MRGLATPPRVSSRTIEDMADRRRKPQRAKDGTAKRPAPPLGKAVRESRDGSGAGRSAPAPTSRGARTARAVAARSTNGVRNPTSVAFREAATVLADSISGGPPAFSRRDSPDADADVTAALEAILRRVSADPEWHSIVLATGFAPNKESGLDTRARQKKLVKALAPAVRALDDVRLRQLLLLELMHHRLGGAPARPPSIPWNAPRSRATQNGAAAGDAASVHYRAWLMATLADIGEHFARSVAHETIDKAAVAANLAVARMLRAAALAAHEGDSDALTRLAEASRLYLQRLESPRDDVHLLVPDAPAKPSIASSSVTFGDPPGSIVVIRGSDVVEPTRAAPASVFISAFAGPLRDGHTEDEVAAITAAGHVPQRVPGPLSDEDVALGAWSYFKTPLFHQVVMDLPALLPLDPDPTLLERMCAAVLRARRDARAAQCDAEDTAERVLRALLRCLGCPEQRVRSLLDAIRKEPPAES